MKKLTKKAEKLLYPLNINSVIEYIEKFVKNSEEKLQVTRGFVTNIIEVFIIRYIKIKFRYIYMYFKLKTGKSWIFM